MKKRLLCLLTVILLMVLSACGNAKETKTSTTQNKEQQEQQEQTTEDKKLEKVTIQAPSGISIAAPLYQLQEDNSLDKAAEEVTFLTWNTPDELRARISSNQVDISAVPTYVGANLYNKGMDIKLLNTLIWGILYMVGPDGESLQWDDLKGKTVHVPFKNDMPDLVFRYLLKENGLIEGQDITLEYASTPQEVVQLMVAGKAEYAILPEHTASLAIVKAKQNGQSLSKIASLQDEWAAITGGEPRIPQAGIIANTQLIEEHPEFITVFQQQIADAVKQIQTNPAEAAKVIAKYQDGLEPQFIENLLPYLNIEFVSASDAKEELEFFFEQLATLSPDIIGGTLPDADFYYEPK